MFSPFPPCLVIICRLRVPGGCFFNWWRDKRLWSWESK